MIKRHLLVASIHYCPASESPTAKQSSTTISHSKKVQQQNLPLQNSPVPQSPTAKKSSSRISHSKIVQYYNIPQQKSPAVESPTSKQSSTRIFHIKRVQQQGRCIQFFLSQSQSFIPVAGALYLVFPIIVTVIHFSFLPCQSIRFIIDFQFGHGSQSKIQYQNLFSASCLRGCRICPDCCKSVNPISTRP